MNKRSNNWLSKSAIEIIKQSHKSYNNFNVKNSFKEKDKNYGTSLQSKCKAPLLISTTTIYVH